MKSYLFIVFLLGCSISLSGQTMEQFIEDAEKQHQNENYYGAYDSYRIASEFDSSRMDLWYNQGENARLYTAYETALGAYQRVLQSESTGEFPELQLRMGQVNQFLGNYEEAAAHYERYLTQDGISGGMRAIADKGLEDSQWAAERLQDADPIEVTHLPRDINSEYSDFSFRRIGDLSYFSSNRIKYEEDPLVPVRYLARIFRVRGNDTLVSPPLLPEVPEMGQHTAHTAFNTDRSRVYYTICEYVGDTESVRCDLHFSPIGPNGEWGPPSRMKINMDSVNTTQPHVALDPITASEALFFASNRPGGQGGMDIYRTTLQEDGTATEVTNLTAINTAGDEITPFFDSEACRLYFSTDGRETMGGFDIYYASAKEGYLGDPVHLNYPVNGSFHDRYYMVHREDEKAYFSSNRQGDESIHWSVEENACCDDIYSVPFDESVQLNVYTYRELDRTDLNRATVKLYQLNADKTQSRTELASLTQPESNHFVFTIQPGSDYELVGTRPAFGPDEDAVALSIACASPDSQQLRRDLYLPQLLIVNVFDEKTREKLNGARVRLANNKDNLSSPLADETKAESNRYEFKVSLERPYYILGEKNTYFPKDTILTIPEARVDAQGRFEVDIYLRKPLPPELVPINLYFDNDRPHPSSRRITSDIQYVTTNERYYDRKAAFIEDQIKPGMSQDEEFLTRGQLEDFFENDVLGGRNKLKELAESLHERLQLGSRYSMNIEGAASARGNPAYNKNLSQRRVDSVLDFFRQYDGGKLKTFIDSGALSFNTSFVGDTKADPNDKSVFGLRASRDRRVTITELKVIE